MPASGANRKADMAVVLDDNASASAGRDSAPTLTWARRHRSSTARRGASARARENQARGV